MERLWKRISGLFFASLAAVALTGKANAESDETALPDPAPMAAVEPAAEDLVPAAAPGEPKEDSPSGETAWEVGETVEADEADGETVEAGEEAAAPETFSAELTQEPNAVVADAAAAPAGFGLLSASAGEGLSEDAPAVGEAPAEEDMSDDETPDEARPSERVLVGNAGPQTITSETEITIKTAGFQHIASLVSDGDVNIIGTGILLVDEVELAEGCGVYLQSIEEIYGENGGTAALFVLTGEKDGVKTYTLFNGTYADGNGEHVIPAILDEEYEIPAGISLVVPEGGELVMQSVNVMVETAMTEEGETLTAVSYSTTGLPQSVLSEGKAIGFTSTAPVLTISSGSSLEIQAGASFRLNHITTRLHGFYNSPLLRIQGLLALHDDAVGGGSIEICPEGNVVGDGAFANADEVTVFGGRTSAVTNFHVKDAPIYLHAGADIDEMSYTGTNLLQLCGDCTIGSIRVDDGGLEFYNNTIYEANTVTVTGTISGTGNIWLRGGNILLARGAAACSAAIPDEGTLLGYVYNPSEGILRYDAANRRLRKAPLIPLVGTVVQSEEMVTIPVAQALLSENHHRAGRGRTTSYGYLQAAADDEGDPITYSCVPDAELSYASLSGALGQSVYIVETCVNGAYGYTILSEGSTQTVPASAIVQIVRTTAGESHEPDGGGTSTSTTTAYTGTGILGGSGEGSLTGGTRRLAFSGGRMDASDAVLRPTYYSAAPRPASDPVPEESADEVTVQVETPVREDGCYQLHVEQDGKAVEHLAAPVTASVAFTPSVEMKSKPLFVVFRDADGGLTAFEATYDPVTGTLIFSADITGEFVVVAFSYDGELFTEEFYRALAELDAVRALFAH